MGYAALGIIVVTGITLKVISVKIRREVSQTMNFVMATKTNN